MLQSPSSPSDSLLTLPDRASRRNAVLVLANGRIFEGFALGALGQSTVGEVVFNTAMTGYQEILTDPSYYKQIITFTMPHIGNTGINEEDRESEQVFAAGVVLHQLPTQSSNWRKQRRLTEYLEEKGLVGIAGVDTRRLTRVIREEGAQGACIASLGANGTTTMEALKQFALTAAQSFGSMSGKALAYEVSSDKPYEWTQGEWKLSEAMTGYADADEDSAALEKPLVAVLDLGVKYNILRRLIVHGCRVKVFPAKTSIESIIAENPSGVMLSNGPGDPEPCKETILTIQQLMQKEIPLFGICLGHQLLALALGAKTQKMKFGHHGANHPVIDEASKKVMITSQNHGFSMSDAVLPEDISVTHRSLFDGTVQGFTHKTKPFFGFQGHPEASPGPQDIDYLFSRFVALMREKALIS